MPKKAEPNQGLARRSPRQDRAHHKVGLMLEAAMQLLEQGEIEALTTNAVAARAGVSIGSLYQYFKNKQALLDALATRELAAMSEQVLLALQTPPKAPGDRIRGVVRAVLGSYGGRASVHRQLIEHALRQRRGGSRLSPLHAQLQHAFASQGAPLPGQAAVKLSAAEAYVLTHAVAGVLLSMAGSVSPPPARQVEDALVLLAMSYVDAVRRERASVPRQGLSANRRDGANL